MLSMKLQLDPTQKMLLKRQLNKNGQAQRFFTHEIRRLSDPYVPMQTGMLKNSAIEQTNKIIYPQVYSKKQYEENRGRGMRGKLWDRRMWADRGPEIVNAVAKFVGGKSG